MLNSVKIKIEKNKYEDAYKVSLVKSLLTKLNKMILIRDINSCDFIGIIVAQTLNDYQNDFITKEAKVSEITNH